jgi:hypothetical protein
MFRRNLVRASFFAKGCCNVFGARRGWCSLTPCKPAALFAHRSLERGQILGKDVFRTAVKKELIYDFVKYALTVAQSGPKSFVVIMNDSFVDVELQVCCLVHACSVARAAVGFWLSRVLIRPVGARFLGYVIPACGQKCPGNAELTGHDYPSSFSDFISNFLQLHSCYHAIIK